MSSYLAKVQQKMLAVWWSKILSQWSVWAISIDISFYSAKVQLKMWE